MFDKSSHFHQKPVTLTFSSQVSDLIVTNPTNTRTEHRLNCPEQGWIDLVPFGPISPDGLVIACPPKGDVVMRILGFSEAYDHALEAKICDNPVIKIRVSSPAGFALLKLISWSDRKGDKRKSDARDFLYVCVNYQKIPEVHGAVFDNEKMMTEHGWDLERGSSQMLGQDAREIVLLASHAYLGGFFGDSIKGRSLRDFIRESCDHVEQYEEHEAKVRAFINGYLP
ncbi:MAG: hypothetical protein AB2770_03895 [Candidatus Thiodiazotropha taylori]